MILVDSDVLIAHLRGMPVARDWLLAARRDSGPLAVSVVSLVEVGGGMRSAERREVRRLLASLRAVPVSESIAWSAAELMRTTAGRMPPSGSATPGRRHRQGRGPGARHPKRAPLPHVRGAHATVCCLIGHSRGP